MADDLNINDERAVRLQKLEDLKAVGIDPYPARVSRTHTTAEALETKEGSVVTVTGRLFVKREIGKLTFGRVRDDAGEIQVVFMQPEIGEDNYTQLTKMVDVGDIIGITGTRFQTKNGEESIRVISWTMLAKSLLPLPDKHKGLQNEEIRMRKRYLDYLVNSDAKKKIITRSKLVWALRSFMQKHGFIEVETPILETVASGAMAKTFDTHLNAFDLDVSLRIAIELPQKRLLVGGFEKIFEIGRCFRNEGVDYAHNPEFTQIEYYWAYADYEDNMRLHEEMLPQIIEQAIGTKEIQVGTQKINFSAPYPRVTFRDTVLEHSGVDINEHDTKEKLAAIMREKGYTVEDHAGFGRLADTLYKATARPQIIQPTFVLNYPAELKPLAKKAADERYTEMFQLLVNGAEISNSYTELNDPLDQRERFEEQAAHRQAGDDEAMAYDREFVEALEHGMPPATGTGIGIDRLAALVSGAHSVREVITFPTVRPKSEEGEDSHLSE